jgi:tyrosyl-tRNA synthetase
MKDGKKEWAKYAEEIKAGKRKNFAAHLEERGLIHDVVGYVFPRFAGSRPLQSDKSIWGSGADFLPCCRERELLHQVFTEKRAGIYVGIDPTAPSMHVGHMLPFMVLAWGYVWGLPVTFLVSQLVLAFITIHPTKGI